MAIEVRNFRPVNNSSDIPVHSNIEFDLVSTDGDEIDISTLSVQIDVISKIDELTLTDLYSYADLYSYQKTIQYTGNSGYYKIFLNPEKTFEQGMEVTIRINVDDLNSISMTEYVSSFKTVYKDLISDFRYAVMNHTQEIAVYNEVLLPNNTESPSIFRSAFRNWNRKPDIEIKKNQVIIDSGFSIDYDNGKIYFENNLDYNDQIEASYTFRFFSDEQINAYFKQSVSIWNISPPYGGFSSIYSAPNTMVPIIFIGAAMFALRDLLLSLSSQEKRLIFDMRSWDEGWKSAMEIFKGLHDQYKGDWEKVLEAKKVKLPKAQSIVTPSYSLPGGRSRFFRYMYKSGASN